MKRRLLIAFALLPLLALPAAADKISLGELSRYLNSYKTAEGEFTQINADGTISTGRIFIRRPGRVRFEYNPPDKSLVLAGGGTVAVFDDKSNTSAEQFPLRRTPLNLILANRIDLSQARMVVGHSSDGTTTSVVAQDPDHPDYGNIRLVFTDAPVELRQWVITDSSGGQTTVVLGELEKGMSLQPSLFNIQHEIDRRSR